MEEPRRRYEAAAEVSERTGEKPIFTLNPSPGCAGRSSRSR